jgi:hypothetical protein
MFYGKCTGILPGMLKRINIDWKGLLQREKHEMMFKK